MLLTNLQPNNTKKLMNFTKTIFALAGANIQPFLNLTITFFVLFWNKNKHFFNPLRIGELYVQK